MSQTLFLKEWTYLFRPKEQIKNNGKMTKRILGLAALFLLLALNINAQKQIQKLQMAAYAISHFYVDSVDDNKMVETAIKAMLKELDPHSEYMSPEDVKTFNERMNGNFDGIGIQFNVTNDTLFVIQPISDGPSEKAGIKAGDRIIAVNDTAIAGVKMSTDVMMAKIRGKKGTTVKLDIIRKGVDNVMVFNIKRDKIPLKSINSYYMVDKNIGYIKLEQFIATSPKEFTDALKDLKSQGMVDLIIDLKGNGGGYLGAAVDIASNFFKGKNLVVYTEGLNSPSQEISSKGNGKFEGRVVVLVDEYTASASEILSGSIQDHDRGLVIGRRTYGKGLVQRLLDLPDGSIIKLTTSRYYIPSGRCIQKPYDNDEEYEMDITNRYNHGEMVSADSIHFPDSLKYHTLKLNRPVYGGGGIMPDYFIPLDTTLYTKLFKEIVINGIMNGATTEYVDKNRDKLNSRYKTFESFEKKFKMDNELLDIMKAKIKEAKIEFNDSTLEETMPMLEIQLKGIIARDLWNINEYYKITGRLDNTLQKAIEILKSGTYEKILSRKDEDIEQ